jgi:hypothetical protein
MEVTVHSRNAAGEASLLAADTRIAGTETERSAVGQARAEASQAGQGRRSRRGPGPRAPSRPSGRRNRTLPVHSQAPKAAKAETGRVRADADKMLVGFRADAARDRDESRADLRAGPNAPTPTATN